MVDIVDMCRKCDSVTEYYTNGDNLDRRSAKAKKISRDISKYIGDTILLEIDSLISKVDVIDKCNNIIDNDNLPLDLSPNRQGFSNEEIDHLLGDTYWYVHRNISKLIKRYRNR